MDIFITVVTWIIGFYVAFILVLAIVFSAAATGAGDGKKSNMELNIVLGVASVLLISLIWVGVSSLMKDDETIPFAQKIRPEAIPVNDTSNIEHKITVETKDKALSKSTVPTSHYDEVDFALWSLYLGAFVLFFWWIFGPSKKSGRGRTLVKKKFVASMRLKADETGLRPWNPNWKPEDEVESSK